MIRKLLVSGLISVVVLAGVAGFFYFRRPPAGEPVTLEILPGETTRQIATKLASEKVIGSVFAFRVMAKVRGVDGKIEAGRYELNRGMGVQAALDVLGRTPEVKGVAITVPEGFTLRQVAARLGARSQVSAADFVTAATSGSVRAHIEPAAVRSLEGFLFPETYLVTENEKAADVARRMVFTFEDATSQLDWSFPEAKGLSRYQALIIASLVEREAKVPEDRSKVAAVIYNRLAKGMRLQIDATAIYGLEQHKVPTLADLRRPSAYNTYLISGLPPTPIANPGLDAIDAALHPAPIDALYYVVCESSGKHCFTSDAGEFQRLKARRPAEVH